MYSQFFIVNATCHNMCLKTHKTHVLKWCLCARSAYGWQLPNDANHDTKFKIKHDGQIIAYLWIDRNGLLKCIKNLGCKFVVMSDNMRRSHSLCNRYLDISRHPDGSAIYPHARKPTTIVIRQNCCH